MVDSSFIQILLYYCINWSVNTSKKVNNRNSILNSFFLLKNYVTSHPCTQMRPPACPTFS